MTFQPCLGVQPGSTPRRLSCRPEIRHDLRWYDLDSRMPSACWKTEIDKANDRPRSDAGRRHKSTFATLPPLVELCFETGETFSVIAGPQQLCLQVEGLLRVEPCRSVLLFCVG